jgi:abhydrolase domain-containing protein 6
MRVSIIWGTADRLFAMKSVEIIRGAVPGVQINLINNCGHVPQLEKPKDFTAVIRSILQEEAA